MMASSGSVRGWFIVSSSSRVDEALPCLLDLEGVGVAGPRGIGRWPHGGFLASSGRPWSAYATSAPASGARRAYARIVSRASRMAARAARTSPAVRAAS